jgi:hypothetical protein
VQRASRFRKAALKDSCGSVADQMAGGMRSWRPGFAAVQQASVASAQAVRLAGRSLLRAHWRPNRSFKPKTLRGSVQTCCNCCRVGSLPFTLRFGLIPSLDPTEATLISIAHRFLFIHVPKTGGNSIQNVLRTYSDDTLVCISPHHDGLERFEVRSSKYKTVKHSTFADYQREYGNELLKDFFTFCCVRNPWDRCISHFFSPHRGHVEWNKAAFIGFVETEIKPFCWYIADHFQTGSLQQAVENIDFVIRFENLQTDFDVVCKKLSLPPAVLPHRNASSKNPYQQYYDSDTEGVVASRLFDEIEYFGYSLHNQRV